MNELDQFVKHQLKIKYYLRYADDFVLLNSNKENLYQYTSILVPFLENNLKLELHPEKIILRKLEWGIDFLGYVVLPHYILSRTKTKQRMFKKVREKINHENFNQSVQSYVGYLEHASSYIVMQKLKNQIWL